MNIKAVLFDRDGTLVDSEPAHLGAISYSLGKFGFQLKESQHSLVIGKFSTQYLPELHKTYAFDDSVFLEAYLKKYSELMKKVVFPEDSKNIIREIRKTHRVGLVTNSGMKSTLELLADLKKEFSTIITSDYAKTAKPDPKIYLLAAQEIGVKPEECLVVEDSQTGLDAAKGAGMFCVIIRNEFNKSQEFLDADAIIEKLSEVKKFL